MATNPSTSTTSLVADIGGTHVRIAQSKGATVQHIEKYRCADFTSLTDAITHYMGEYGLHEFTEGCLAVAAPTGADEIAMTNSEWRISIGALKAELGLQRLEAINDFEAVAWAIPNLPHRDTIQIGGKQPDETGNIAVLGPGTGLGVKHLTRCGDDWKVLSGEGGHVDFAPVDGNDLALWQFLQREAIPLAIEEILSGRGLVHIYQAIVAREGSPSRHDEPEAILREGLLKTSENCAAALHQFVNVLGSFAGNLALNLNTTGGVYLCGGVVVQLTEFVQTSAFRERFDAKGRFRFYVEEIPVFLITEPEPGLLGAAAYLQSRKQ